ncbi:MAG: hypothetical protein DME18_04520 [Verrucomicrobia bacterium]|nr:MAG: hypothetical protein DME18_04520 [Verrucomicrobiota bacterium]
MENQEQSAFVQSRLPWLITATALVVYALTLNRWVSLSSLPIVAGVARETLAPSINEAVGFQPLHFLVLLPFRLLPAAWQPAGLNLFAAICGALTLGLLARSVALLPHDRTREQRQRERSEFSLLSIPAAWVPPLFAALVCGLQSTFWEHATAATGEMLDLLLFAYVIRCLLAYRSDTRGSWLTRSALVYGIAATSNFGMIGFFPAYLLALIWIKGLSFFEFRFLARMFGWGAAGLTLYLLLPLLYAINDPSGLGFWRALRLPLVGEKGALLFPPLRSIALCAGLTSLLPLLLIGIRWPSTFGETSPVGAAVTALMFRGVHAAFLAAGIWTAFDAQISARSLVDKRLLQQIDDPWYGVNFLTFYYLGAICLGYFVGYFLLVFGRSATQTRQKISPTARLVNPLVMLAVGITVIAAPVGLVYRNLPLIRANSSLLRDFAGLTTLGFPAHDIIALSDQPYILALTGLNLRQKAGADQTILADTGLMPFAFYQQALHRRFPARWPELPPPETPMATLDRSYLMYQASVLAHSNDVYYLHPSFGYYFEPFYLQPHGLIYHLQPYATNAITYPPPSDALIKENQEFWSQARPALERLATLIGKRINDARVVGRWYSRALDWWGVELQKLGRLEDAALALQLARTLNPQNVAVDINLSFNQTLRGRGTESSAASQSLEEKFGRYQTWNALLAVNGPIDDPGICLRLGKTFASQSLFRQAALQFTRVLQLEPDNLEARFWLANVFLLGQLPEKALEVAGEIRARQATHPLNSTNLIDLVRLESMAHLGKGDTNTAERLLLAAHRQHPQNNALLDSLVQLYVQANLLTNALAALDEQLKLKPDNAAALLSKAYICMKLETYDQAGAAIAAVLKSDPENVQALLDKGAICIQTKAYKDAVAPLNQVLKLQPNNPVALMNRAIANLQNDQLDAAQRDYETLQKLLPGIHRVYYGLGEIAFRRKDVPAAIKHYDAYLKHAPPDTEEAKQIAQRLSQLKASSDH